MGCSGGVGGGGAYGVATVGGMQPPHRDGFALGLAIISSCCCVSTIEALNSAVLLLLRCIMELLTMLKALKQLRMVLRM